MPEKYSKGTLVRIYNRDPKSNLTVLIPELEKYHDQIGKLVNVRDLGTTWEVHHSRHGQAVGGEPKDGSYRSVHIYVVQLDSGDHIEVADDRCLRPVGYYGLDDAA